MTAISWLDEQILALDRIVDLATGRITIGPYDSRNDPFVNRPWICQAIGSDTHPFRITDGAHDLGHYATLENAQRALAEMTA